MKTFKRTSLPTEIKYNGEVYRNDSFSSGKISARSVQVQDIINHNKLLGKKTIMVEALSRRLKGVNDLHGSPYKPTKWIFTNN